QLALGLWMGAEGWDTNDRKMFEMPFADYRYRKKWESIVEERAREEYASIAEEHDSETVRAGFDLTYHIARELAGLGEASVEELEKQYTFHLSGLPVNVGEYSIRPAKESETHVDNFFEGKSIDEIVHFMTTNVPNAMNKVMNDNRLYGDLRKFVIPIYEGENVVATVNIMRKGNIGQIYEPKNKKTYDNPVEFVKEFKEKSEA
ncbi:MAG: hypothetical protein QXU82_01545, partial [Candidatus Aenigmatarchaeota archaeon]